MRITRIETLCLSRPHEPEHEWITARSRTIKAEAVIVAIHTDAGLTGLGEASPYGLPPLIRSWVSWLAVELTGRDPGDPTLAPHPNGQLPAATGHLPFLSPHDCAVAAIDAALWDLRGKLSGRPVRALLAAQPRERVRLYASSGCRYAWNERPEQPINETLTYVAQGYTAGKVRIGTEWAWDGVTAGRFLELMQALHTAVAGRMELMVDGNQRRLACAWY